MSRLGPQLFSFGGEDEEGDLLAKIWNHPSFAHLKSKWMYISFSDAAREGAAQGALVPFQNDWGDVLAKSGEDEPVSSKEVKREVKKEVAEVRSEVGRLEEYIAGMMEALERNTQKSAELAAKIVGRESLRGAEGMNAADGKAAKVTSRISPAPAFDMDALAAHFAQLNQTLEKNSQNVEALAKQHCEGEQRLREMLEATVSTHDNDQLDMQRLSAHLDRIQAMMEESTRERKDSAREMVEAARPVDFSPLTQRLEKVLEAVEQNSALVKELLEGKGNGSEVKEPPPQMDMSPLLDSLQQIHVAIEQQSEHTKAFAQNASTERESNSSGQDRVITSLGERLEQVHNAIEEGNRHAREPRQEFNLEPLERHLEVLKNYGEKHNGHLERLVESQNATREAVEAGRGGHEIDLSPLVEHAEATTQSMEANTEAVQRLVNMHSERDETHLSPLLQHVEAVRQSMEANTSDVRHLVEMQSERSEEQDSELSHHLTKLHTLTTQNATQLQSLIKQQTTTTTSATKVHSAVSETSTQLRRLLERNKDHEIKLEAQNSQMREVMSGQREMVEVMRQLAKSLVAHDQRGCGHVVVPPPRKMNRKLVGFVYDTKEGAN